VMLYLTFAYMLRTLVRDSVKISNYHFAFLSFFVAYLATSFYVNDVNATSFYPGIIATYGRISGWVIPVFFGLVYYTLWSKNKDYSVSPKPTTFTSPITKKEIQSKPDKPSGLEESSPILKNVKLNFEETSTSIYMLVCFSQGGKDIQAFDSVKKWLDEIYQNTKILPRVLSTINYFADKHSYTQEELDYYFSHFTNRLASIIKESEVPLLLNGLQQIMKHQDQHFSRKIELLNQLIDVLNIDVLAHTSLIGKILPIDRINLKGFTVDKYLGINARYGKPRQKEMLRDLYKVWSITTTSPNKIEAYNSRYILQYISQKRAMLDEV
jgi:hypothetical protein